MRANLSSAATSSWLLFDPTQPLPRCFVLQVHRQLLGRSALRGRALRRFGPGASLAGAPHHYDDGEPTPREGAPGGSVKPGSSSKRNYIGRVLTLVLQGLLVKGKLRSVFFLGTFLLQGLSASFWWFFEASFLQSKKRRENTGSTLGISKQAWW